MIHDRQQDHRSKPKTQGKVKGAKIDFYEEQGFSKHKS